MANGSGQPPNWRIPVPGWGSLPWPRFRRLTIALPVFFLLLGGAVLLATRAPGSSPWRFVVFAAVSVGASLLFSLVLLETIERAYRRMTAVRQRLEERNVELEALRTAGLAMVQDLDLRVVLRQVADLSRAVVRARFAALRVLDPPDESWRFVASGMAPEVMEHLGHPPSGGGLLGFAAGAGRTVRLTDLNVHPSFSGFPDGHPPMRTFLSTPVVFRDEVLGQLYLTEKEDGSEFTAADEGAIERFALQAAAAISNARLLHEVARLSTVEERERIGRELHDGTIQSLYALSLHLQAALLGEGADHRVDRDAIDEALSRLHDILVDIRRHVFGSGEAPASDRASLRASLGRLVAEASPGELPAVRGRFSLQGNGGLDAATCRSLLLAVREALSNAVRHSGASRIRVVAVGRRSGVAVRVHDDGRGLGSSPGEPGHGLDNMRRRMEALGGRMDLRTAEGGGTRITLLVPAAASG